MKNEIMQKEYGDITISGKDTVIQLSPEARQAVFELGAGLMGNMVTARKEALIATISKELELQISAMEHSVTSQKNVLDTHERKQKDLLEKYNDKQKVCLAAIANETSEEMKRGLLDYLEQERQTLETSYLDNNRNVDSALDKTKQQPKGILGSLISRFR